MTLFVFLLFLIEPICQIALADLQGSVPGMGVRENVNLTETKVLHKEKNIPALKNASLKNSKQEDDDLLSQALTQLRKMNEQTKNGSWSENSDETLTMLYSLVEIETKLTKFDEKAPKTIQELNKNLMTNSKNGMIGESQSLKELSEEMSKTIDTMKKNEDKATKVSIDGVNGTLAQILPKANVHKRSIRLQIYVQVMKLLNLIHERMEQSPEKDTIGKVIGKSTVANCVKTVMPSQLVGLIRELWIHFLQRIRKPDQNKATQTNPKIKQNEVIPKKQKHFLSNKQKQEKQKQLVSLADKFRRRRRSPLPIVIIRSLSLVLAILCITVIALEHHSPWAVVVIAFLALYSQQENNRNFPTQIADGIGNIAHRICGTRHTEGNPCLNGHRNNYGHESHRNISQRDVPQAYSNRNYVQNYWHNLAPQANELYAPVRNANPSASGNSARRSSNDNNGRAAASGSVRQRLITTDLTLEINYRAPANRNNNNNNSRPGVESSRSRRPNRVATNSLAISGNNQRNEMPASRISEESGEEKDDNNSIRSKCTACKLENSSSSSENNSRPGVESSRSRRPNRVATNSLARSGNNQRNEMPASRISEESGEKNDDKDNSIRSKCTACLLGNSSSSSENNSRPGVESSRSRRPNRVATNSLAISGNNQRNEMPASRISEESGEEKDDNNSIRSKYTACKLENSSSSSSSSDMRNAKAAEKNEDSDDHDDDRGDNDDGDDDKKDSDDDDDANDNDYEDDNDVNNVSNDKEAQSSGSNSSSEPSVIVISTESVGTNESNDAEIIKENLSSNQSYYAESIGRKRKEDADDEDDDDGDDDEFSDNDYEDDDDHDDDHDHDDDEEKKKKRENDRDAHPAESSDESREETDNEDNASDDEKGEKERKTVGGVGKG